MYTCLNLEVMCLYVAALLFKVEACMHEIKDCCNVFYYDSYINSIRCIGYLIIVSNSNITTSTGSTVSFVNIAGITSNTGYIIVSSGISIGLVTLQF